MFINSYTFFSFVLGTITNSYTWNEIKWHIARKARTWKIGRKRIICTQNGIQNEGRAVIGFQNLKSKHENRNALSREGVFDVVEPPITQIFQSPKFEPSDDLLVLFISVHVPHFKSHIIFPVVTFHNVVFLRKYIYLICKL